MGDPEIEGEEGLAAGEEGEEGEEVTRASYITWLGLKAFRKLFVFQPTVKLYLQIMF